MWRSHRPEDLATPGAFARDPRLVWEWYDWRRQRIAGCAPNRAHEVLAAWTQRWSGCTVITQNVDGLHERAGTARVIRLHGSIWELSCFDGCLASPAATGVDLALSMPAELALDDIERDLTRHVPGARE